ncbi:MAG: DNA polymerase III subunit delta [Candidatus Bipolaricaulia bacterium]
MNVELHTGDAWRRGRAIRHRQEQLNETSPQAWSETRFDGESFSLARCLEALEAPALFEDAILVHIARADKLSEDAAEGLARAIERGLPDSRMLLVEADKLDKRKTLFKAIKAHGEVHDHPAPNRRDLPNAVKGLLDEHQLELSRDAFRYLLESVEGDLSRMAQEIDKLSIYARGISQQTLEVEDLRGVLFHDRGGDVFAALDAWIERGPDAPARLREILAGGVDAGKIFFLLAGQVRSLLQVKSLAAEEMSNDEIARRTGTFKWLVGKRRKQIASLGEAELIALLKQLHAEDVLIKRGAREPEESLWALLIAWTDGPLPGTSSSASVEAISGTR